MRRDVYSGRLKLNGEEHGKTVLAAYNYAASLVCLGRFEQAGPMRKSVPVARRVLGENHELAIRLRWNYATALYHDKGATRASRGRTTLEETERTARRVLGGAHPITVGIERAWRREPRWRPRRRRRERRSARGSTR